MGRLIVNLAMTVDGVIDVSDCSSGRATTTTRRSRFA
jgi:hypothetical protein